MADLLFIIVGIIGFFALSAAYVLGLDRIVESEFDDHDELTEVAS